MFPVTLLRGDCLDLMQTLPAQSVDMVLCDLPYGTTGCAWDSVIPFEPMWAQYRRVAKPNAAIVLTASQPFTSALGASNLSWLKYAWTWRKSRPSGHLNAKRMPLRDIEDILVFYNQQPTYNPQGVHACSRVKKNTPGRLGAEIYGSVSERDHMQVATGYPRQILDFPSVHNVGAFHPTQKPVALMEYLIRTYTNPGATVLDNCMGSGTTGVACANTGRRFVGIERDPKYFDICCERIGGVIRLGNDIAIRDSLEQFDTSVTIA